MPHVAIAYVSRLSLPDVFEALADHNNLGKVFGVPVRRIRDGQSEPNGVGSVRKIGVGPLGIEETVTALVPNESIDYRITRGGFPIKNHRGRIAFAHGAQGGTRVDWTIEFESRLPLMGPALAFALKTAISTGLKRVG